MAARVKTRIFHVGKSWYVHAVLSRLDSASFNFSQIKYEKVSRFWKPTRREITVNFMFWRLKLDLRLVLQ